MAMIFSGIDIGTTNIKVLLVDAAGQSLWVKSAPSPRVHDGIGPATDGMALVAALEGLMEQGWRAVAKGKPFAAIATTGVGEDGFCVDAQCRPRSLAIPWFDKRDRAEADALKHSAPARTHPAINFDFSTMAAKWAWSRTHRPEALAGDDPWITLTDYPAVWWSRTPFINQTLLPRTGIYDVFTRSIIAPLAKLAGAPRLPPGIVAGHVVGPMVRGPLHDIGVVNDETLIVSGGHDHPIASSVILRINPLARVDSIGTANAMYAETTEVRASAATAGVDLTLPTRGGPGLAALGPIEFTSRLIKVAGDEAKVRAALADSHIAGEPMATPPVLAQALVNAGPHQVRRVLEALTHEARGFFASMRLIGVADGPLYATGGWARSRALMELRASLFGETITTLHEPEMTALGAALYAREALIAEAPHLLRNRDSETIDPRADWLRTYATWPIFRKQIP
jgi:xylulokinase